MPSPTSWRSAPLNTQRWRRVRAYVLRRDGYRCQLRGPGCTELATTVDHVRPLCAGGAPYDPGNLRAACGPCNSASGAKLAHRSAQLGTPSRSW